MPKVSVIIPNYNHASFLAQRIESVLNQTFTDLEVILMDDCSTDHSTEIIAEYAKKDSRIRVNINENNSGSTFIQWNKGAELAKGDYLWIAESDDFAAHTLLEELVPILDQHSNVALAYGQTTVVNEEGEELRSYLEDYMFLFPEKANRWTKPFIRSGKEEAGEFLLFHNTIPNASAALIRKSSYLAVGGAEPTWKLNGDWMFYVKLLMNGDIAFHPALLNFFRTHPVTQRQRANLTPVVYDEITAIIQYIQKEVHPAHSQVVKAYRTVAGWWTGSLFRQKWNSQNAAHNGRLFFKFLRWKPWLPVSMVLSVFFFTLSNLTTWLGIKGELRKLINKLFPGLLFNPNSKETKG